MEIMEEEMAKAKSETSDSGTSPTSRQFMKQKTAWKETCLVAVQPCTGAKSIVKKVEVAEGKLPKSPAPSFVVPTSVSSGFFCGRFYQSPMHEFGARLLVI